MSSAVVIPDQSRQRVHRTHRHLLPCLSWVCLAFFATIVNADDTGSHAVAIPEPLVFDLVRGLGAKRGEFEANVLVEVPLNDTSDRPVAWAPEIEAAIFDGVALEFEVPFEDQELEAYKVAAQFTFGSGFDDTFIHGTQFIVEDFDHDDLTEVTALYLAGVRFNERWSVLSMLGYRWHDGDDAPEEDDTLALHGCLGAGVVVVMLGYFSKQRLAVSQDSVDAWWVTFGIAWHHRRMTTQRFKVTVRTVRPRGVLLRSPGQRLMVRLGNDESARWLEGELASAVQDARESASSDVVPCPGCGGPVASERELRDARGVECPHCGTGLVQTGGGIAMPDCAREGTDAARKIANAAVV